MGLLPHKITTENVVSTVKTEEVQEGQEKAKDPLG